MWLQTESIYFGWKKIFFVYVFSKSVELNGQSCSQSWSMISFEQCKRHLLMTYCSGEAGLFEEAINKYGKDFSDIQKDFVSSHGYAMSSVWSQIL